RLALGARRSRSHLALDALYGVKGADQIGKGVVVRGLRFAIVDEADSVVIEEARTPLILSGVAADAGKHPEEYETALTLARKLTQGQDFLVLANERAIQWTPCGERTAAEVATGLKGIWTIRRAREELIKQALAALYLF